MRRLAVLACVLLLALACGADGDDDDENGAARPPTSLGPTLPSSIPSSGLAEPYDGGVHLRALDGTLLADLPNMVIHSDSVPGDPLYVYEWVEEKAGAILRLDPANARWVEERPPAETSPGLPPPADPGSAMVLGHWRWAVSSPTSDVRLAQWSGECEVPAAFFVEPDGSSRSVLGGSWLEQPNTFGIGWLPDGRALVEVSSVEDAPCGSGSAEPGVYAVDPATGERTRFDAVTGGVMWGDA